MIDTIVDPSTGVVKYWHLIDRGRGWEIERVTWGHQLEVFQMFDGFTWFKGVC